MTQPPSRTGAVALADLLGHWTATTAGQHVRLAFAQPPDVLRAVARRLAAVPAGR
jgi:hypothetical protein